MNYKAILAITDMSAKGDAAAWRAGMLAANCAATLELLHVPPNGQIARGDHGERLREFASSISKHVGRPVQALSSTESALPDIAAAANSADLLVMPYRPENKLLAFFRGAWHQRVMRLTRCPVLIARTDPRKTYDRIVVSVALDSNDKQLVHHACEVDDRAQIELFHAINRMDEAKLRSADVSWHAVVEFRKCQDEYVQRRMGLLVQSLAACERSLTTSFARVDDSWESRAQHAPGEALLTVVGRRQRSALTECFLGAQSIAALECGTSDVLIVPNDCQASSRATAKRRIATELGDGRGAYLRGNQFVRSAPER